MKNDRNKSDEEKNNIHSDLEFYDLYFSNLFNLYFRDLIIFCRSNSPFLNQVRNGPNKMNEQKWFVLMAIFIVLVFVGMALLIAKIGIFLEKSFFG